MMSVCMIFDMKRKGMFPFDGSGLFAENGLFCSGPPVVPSAFAVSVSGALLITAPLRGLRFSRTVFNKMTTLPAAITYWGRWGYCLHHLICFRFCVEFLCFFKTSQLDFELGECYFTCALGNARELPVVYKILVVL